MHPDTCPHHRAAPPRRRFLQLAALTAGVQLLWSPARAAGSTDALLLSCMDYRLVDDTERYMAARGMRERYDHVVLAGAALGAITSRFPAWNQTFWDHLDVAIQLHHIHTVIVLDHRDCGAYKVILGPAHAADPALERDTHAGQLHALRAQIAQRYPALKVETLLMALDGSVEAVE